MKRVIEPELMNDPEQAAAYAGSDLDRAYWLFMQCFKKYFPAMNPEGAILDLGCGTAGIPLRLARRFPACEIYGVDGAPRMLAYAKQAVQREGLENRIHLVRGILPHRPSILRRHYEMIVSNSFLHHLADPMVLWQAVREYGLPDATILIVDLLRPESEERLQTVVNKYMPDAPAMLRQDMTHSLRAAFTLDEVTSQLHKAGLAESLCLEKATPFQFAVYGNLRA